MDFVLGALLLATAADTATGLHATGFQEAQESAISNFTVEALRAGAGGDVIAKAMMFDQEIESAIGGVCGTRPMMPQMQLDLEIYSVLGILKSSYARCEGAGVLEEAHEPRNFMLEGEDPFLELRHKNRTAAAGTLISVWSMVTFAVMLSFTCGACAVPRASKGKTSERISRLSWVGLSWLDGLLSHFRTSAGSVSLGDLDGAGSADMERSAHEVFMQAWHHEVSVHGSKATVSNTVRIFLGWGTVFRIFSAAIVSAVMEFVGLPVALDLLLSSLRKSAEERASQPWLSHDLLNPVLAAVFLGFGVPLVCRVANAVLALSDGYHSQRIVAGMLASTYDKCLRLSAAGGRGCGEADPIALVNNDIVKIWTGAVKLCAHAVVAPLCMVALVGLLVFRLGSSAVLGAGAMLWLCVLYLPVRDLARQWNDRWLKDLDARVGVLRETTCNARGIQATSRQGEAADRLLALRERELKSRFGYVLVQSLLNVPMHTLPYALTAITLGFHYYINEEIHISDIFICMQALSGLTACTVSLISATQRTLLLPASCRRVERFLLQPERPATVVRQPARHPDAAHIHVKGSFAYEADAPPVLRDVDFAAKRGELVAVVGGTASGKTAFLNTMLGQMASTSKGALVEAPERVAYCAQTPWISEGGLQENVTLGEYMDLQRYNEALAAAALEDIGERAQKAEETLVVSNAGPASQEEEHEVPKPKFPYFILWNVFTIIAFLLSIMNVQWESTPFILGVCVVITQAILHWSVLEIPLQALSTFFYQDERPLRRADGSSLKIALNYNLLATCEQDVEELMVNMHEAYWHNLAENVSAILVSATNDPELKRYEFTVRDQWREKIFKDLKQEGLVWAGVQDGDLMPAHTRRIWSKYEHLNKAEFVNNHLDQICQRYAEEFMVLQRTHRVLKKCGQYQDLMLLSAGDGLAYTYTDPDLYGPMGRKKDEPLFLAGADVDRVVGRGFDYTLVLDADTRVEPGSVFVMLDIAAAYPHRSLIQPAIKMDVAPKDSLFMHLEGMRQSINEPMNKALTQILGKSGFFGKGLIKNQHYIDKCLGTRENLIETVPIDVLSHDTFEAAVLEPMYAADVHLLEAPCGNYVTWDIRERRWNRGELLLGMYFFPRLIGDPFKWASRKLQGNKFFSPQMRTETELDEVSSYVAHAALRQMALKPALVSYIVLVDFVNMHFTWTPILAVMFLIIVFPKFAVCTRDNFKACVIETVASILQFTPESVVGTIRVLRALRAHLTGNARWVPQRAVEEEALQCNPFIFALRYLWQYIMFAIVTGLVVVNLVPEAIFIMVMLGTLLSLPLYSGFTSLPGNMDEEGENGAPMKSRFPYFTLWDIFTVVALLLSIANVNWDTTPFILGCLVVFIQGTLHWSVLEIPLQTIATFFHKTRILPRADASHLSLILNYNLLATAVEDVDDCMVNMYEAYVGNLGENVSAVLVSATNDPELKRYELQVRDECRQKVRDTLRQEGLCWAGASVGPVDLERHERIWSKYKDMDRNDFINNELDNICEKFALEFMVLHRVSRVLRKCGQYQDLMLLSAGEERAYTYCDPVLYGSLARKPEEPLFHASDDTTRVVGRMFDYTLVLDADTRVEAGSAFDMLRVAAAHPNRALIQPSIKMDVGNSDPLFMVMDGVRQAINAPATDALTAILGKSGFYGKGLIKNSAYIEKCLGTRENLIEIVPVDVLSHDTFEAAVLEPMFGNDLFLLEAPCGNYVTWDIRERRWNRGEILLGMYFFPILLGHPLRWLQMFFMGKKFNRTYVRTECELDHISSYIAHAALRQMILKPCLVAYVVLVDFVDMNYEWTPIITVMFLIIVFPKIAIINLSNWRVCVIETVGSFLQFTPESVVGTIRVLRAFKAHVTGNAMWVPQRAVEDEFKKCNPFLFSLRYLWQYLAFAVVCGLCVMYLVPQALFIMILLGTLFQLPIYAGFTSLSMWKGEHAGKPSGFPYLKWWNALVVAGVSLCVFNIHWDKVSLLTGIFMVALQSSLIWSVLDSVLSTLAGFFSTLATLKRADPTGLKCIINYNIAAVSKADIDTCMSNMFDAYMGNLEADVSAVLVSATEDANLRKYELQLRDRYRTSIYRQLFAEGRSWSGFEHGDVNPRRQERIWSKFATMNRHDFVDNHLDALCAKFADEFMVVHRVGRVLGKCGHYQDLMLLSAGDGEAFTYCDASFYGSMARTFGEPLFHTSKDVDNLRGSGFDCTLVLDAGTSVPAGAVHDLMQIAAGNPDRAIIQPALSKSMGAEGTVFMQTEVLRHITREPLDRGVAMALGECEFRGQALLQNEVYLGQCVGDREELVEVVPISALKPCVFEATATGPLYAGDVCLTEPACASYPAWDILERHQYLTELSMCVHFFPRLMAPWIKALGSPRAVKASRAPFRPGSVSYHIAFRPLRSIAMKPLLMCYFILLDFFPEDFQHFPFVALLLACYFLPKLAALRTSNVGAVFFEIISSLALLVPEAVVGTVRVLSVMIASLAPAPMWKPSLGTVEVELQKSDPFATSLRYLSKYLVFAMACTILVVSHSDQCVFTMIMLGTLFSLPLFAGLTAMTSPASRTQESKSAFLKTTGSDSALWMMAQQNLNLQLPMHSGTSDASLSLRLTPSECARVALARAAYNCNSELVLLDDPFGMVDMPTGEHVLNSLVCGHLLQEKTRIVAMLPRSQQLTRFDRVVVLSQGRIAVQGTPEEVMASPEFKNICEPEVDGDVKPQGMPVAAAIERAVADAEVPNATTSSTTLFQAVSAGGMGKFIASLVLAAMLRVALQGQIIILGRWADQKQVLATAPDERILKMLGIFLVSSCAIQVLQSYMVQSFNISTSKALFARAFAAVLRAPLDKFWSKQQVGRVINRLSGDILTIDMAISTSFSAVVGFLFSIVVQQVYCLMVMPVWLVLPIYGAIALFSRQFYMASWPLQHSSAAALSRCQDLHAQAISAGVSPHAYQQSHNQLAKYCSHLSFIVRPYYLGVSCAKQWLSLRLSLCFCFQATLSVLLGILSPSTVGLGSLAVIVASTFTIMQELDNFVDTITNGMAMAIALDRLGEYFQIAEVTVQAPDAIDPALKLGMLTAGGVRVQVEDPAAGVSLDVQPRSRVCLLGDSGACSQIMRSLAVPQMAEGGSILINSVDARSIDRETFGTAVAYIPQQPFVFKGTVRSAVDATNSMPDARIWRALEAVGLAAQVQALAGGLDHPLAEGSSTSALATSSGEAVLSFGQCQLLCLACAVAQQPALLLLDNSLSALDPQSRNLVHRAIMSELTNTTIIAATCEASAARSFGHVAILRDGTLAQQGTVAEVLAA